MAAANTYVDIELGLRKQNSVVLLDSDPGTSRPESATGPYSARFGETSERGAQRKGTIHSIQSNVSRLSRIASIPPFNFLRTLTQRSVSDPGPFLSDADRNARDEFFKILLPKNGVIISDVTLSGTDEIELLSAYIEWYGKFLESRFRSAWTTLVREALKGLEPHFNEPQPDEIGKVYTFMSVVAKMLLEPGRRDLSMVEIVDGADCADNVHLFKSSKDPDRWIPSQLVFAAVGWLTMLYDPEPLQRPGQFRIRQVIRPTTGLRTRTHTGRVISKFTQDGMDKYDQPISIYLPVFGRLIPEATVSFNANPAPTELITVSLVCFSILDKVADVQIEWVNSLSQHLEFDNVRRRLKIFRFPSFCMLMYRDMTILSNIYLGYNHHIQGVRTDEQEDLTPEFFKEVLLSYRLIFGQDKSSWKAFKKRISTFEDHWDCSDQYSDDADPMLPILCCQGYKSDAAAKIYSGIEADSVSPYYYPDMDFPFLGRRILNLQTFVSGRSPHNLMALWNDKRSVGLWLGFWAVLIIGGGTILLGLLQTAFQIWGSVSSQKQLNLSAPPTTCSSPC